MVLNSLVVCLDAADKKLVVFVNVMFDVPLKLCRCVQFEQLVRNHMNGR